MLRAYLNAAGPWLVLFLVACVGLMVAGVLGAYRRRGWGVAASWSGLWAAMLSISLVPSGAFIGRQCSPVVDLPPLGRLAGLTEEAINFWPYAGLAVLALLSGRRGRVLLPLTVATPVVVEACQFAVPALGRSCSLTDLVINLVGVALGWVAAWSWVRLADRRTPRGPDDPR